MNAKIGANLLTLRKEHFARQRAEAEAAAEAARRKHEFQVLGRQKVALEARDDLMKYVRFTMPDPAAPDDVDKSRYKDARHHRKIARALEEVEKGNIRFLILVCPPRHGKLCADDTAILTPAGWRTHGQVQVGDFVYGPDGQPTRVIAVSEPDTANYSVEFTNGEVVQVHENHEWTVFDTGGKRWRTLETRQLMRRQVWMGPVGKRGGRATFQLPDTTAVSGGRIATLIEPYTLGIWLGDGTAIKAVITMPETDARYVLPAIVAGGDRMSTFWTHPTTGVPTYSFGGKLGVGSPLHKALKIYGLIGRKHIPDAYFIASERDRLDLLAGLIDSDGHVEQHTGRVRIVTGTVELAEGIYRLAASLGFHPYTTTAEPVLSSSGIQGRKVIYTIGFQPTKSVPTKLPRKQIEAFAKRRRVGIRSIRQSEEPKVGRCIQVERSDGLYLVGRSLIPTHNSELVSRRLPAWYSGRHPDHDIVVSTYSDEFAADFGAEVRSIMSSKQHQQVFSGYKLRRGGTAKDRLQTDRGGLLVFCGRSGGLTGRGAHLLICDDLLKNDQEAMSQTIRDQAWNWLTKVALTRRRGNKLVIMTATRWHVDDPIGRLTNSNTDENPYFNEEMVKKIKIIELPGIAEADDTLGRKPGEALWPDGPDKFDLDFLEEQKAFLGPLNFAALYQGRPTLEDGALFRRENIQLYNPVDLPKELRYYCASDHAVGLKQRNDFTVLLKVGVDEHDDIWLTECFWKKAPTDQVVEAMLDMATGKTRPLVWWAESGHISKSIGPFLKKRLSETGKFLNIVEVNPVADKQQRAQSIVARAAMGKLHLPAWAGWTSRALDQMLGFPTATHDDFVDALAYIGLGLRRQYGPDRNVKPKVEPIAGTLAYLRKNDKWMREKRVADHARLF